MEGLLLRHHSFSPSPSLSSPPSIPTIFACCRKNPWLALLSSSTKTRPERSSPSPPHKPTLTAFKFPSPSSLGGGALLSLLPSPSPSPSPSIHSIRACCRKNQWCAFVPFSTKARPERISSSSSSSSAHKPALTPFTFPFHSSSGGGALLLALIVAFCNALAVERMRRNHHCFFATTGKCTMEVEAISKGAQPYCLSGGSRLHVEGIVGDYYKSWSRKALSSCSDFQGSNLSIHEDSTLDGHKTGGNHHKRFREACSLSDFRGFNLSILGVLTFDGQEIGAHYYKRSEKSSSLNNFRGSNLSIYEDFTLDGREMEVNHCKRFQKACSLSDFRGFDLSISGVLAFDEQEIGSHYYERSRRACSFSDFRGSNLSIYEDSTLDVHEMGTNHYERFREPYSLSNFQGFDLSILGISTFDGQEIGVYYHERSRKPYSYSNFQGSKLSIYEDSTLDGHEMEAKFYERFQEAYTLSDFRGFDLSTLGVLAFDGQVIGAHYIERSRKALSCSNFRGSNLSIYEDSTIDGHKVGANHYKRSRKGYSWSDFRGFDSLISGVSAYDGEEIGAHYHERLDKPSSNNFEGTPQMRRNKINSFVKDAVAQVGPSVVRLDTQRIAATTTNSGNHYLLSPWFKGDDSDKSPREKGVGSGFVVDSKQGLIATNAHVVKGADHVKVTFTNGKSYEGTVIGLDDITDLAVLKVTKSIQGIPEAPMGDSETVELGDCVIAFGHPLGLDNTISLGIISSLSRTAFEVGIVGKQLTLFQTDCAINPGNSGGPLANEFGEVIGINTAIRADAEGIAFAIPINIVKRVVEALSKGLVIKHPFLGIQMENFYPHNNSSRKDVWGLDCEGVLVLKVYEGSSASRAGLRSGDVIVEVDGEKIFGTSQLYRQIWRLSIGQEFTLCIYRGEERIEISVKLCESSDLKESGGL